MLYLNNFLHHTPLSTPFSCTSSGCEKDFEDSTLVKIAACVPILGTYIIIDQDLSLSKKLEDLPLPREINPHPILGKQLDNNATLDEKITACKRAAQLDYIRRDYAKLLLVNQLLTIALTVYAVAINIIPFALGVACISMLSLTTAGAAFIVYHNFSRPSFYEQTNRLRM